MDVRVIRYDHPDARKLDEEVQVEYAERYGDGDLTHMDAAHFDPPHGLYLIVYDTDGTPVASGGWRSQERSDEGYEDGDAEIKRMFVVRAARGRGLARRILAALEDSAREAGRVRMVLETGTEQPEAIALYTSSGYAPVTKFGFYRFEETSRCYAKLLTDATDATATTATTATTDGLTGAPASP
ncbi:GNAT family N-acetyltransferase [Streptomyces iranensis]|uniref:GNAT superfamily N-acetyltransferase n=1 Tax=Streptomyces iranensis TaxID=576784 RepID=A0ABS4MT25_9ACTN|nr:GNAT family N-acetyltransferase [Streptomyces iranensis]MBP2062416.1 GNAT superfamily N-acetyltransferase [Streptomyces iranensis]